MRQAGLSHVEWGSDVHAPCGDRERLCEIAQMQKELGVTCSSYGTYFRLGETPLSELEHYIAAANILGTEVLRLWCGAKSGADMTPGEKEALFEQCRKAAVIAEKNGVMLCMECHKKTFTERKEDSEALMRAIASPSFRMYWQPFQWLTREQNAEVARTVSPFTEHIHVFHWKGDQKLSLWEGMEEWREYLSLFSTPRTLLLEFMPDGQLESLPREAEALKIMIGDTE